MSVVDYAFVRAISTIRTMSRGPNGLGRPPPEARTTLYGLYKQATEGDVLGIMDRPVGTTTQDEANRRKWDAWRAHHGLTRAEAKLRYIEFLLETMQAVSTGTPEANALLDDLANIYNAAKTGEPLPGTSGGPVSTAHNRAWSMTSNNSTYSQFLRRPPTYSEFGLSVGDRTELRSERAADFAEQETAASQVGPVPTTGSLNGGFPGATSAPGFVAEEAVAANANWRQDVAWQLETINEEINSMRRRYGDSAAGSRRTPAGQGGTPPSNGRDVWAEWLLVFRKGAKVALSRLGDLSRRVVIDIAGLTLFLIVVRMVRNSPGLLEKMPLTRRFFTIVGNLIAVILKEVGFDVRPRTLDSIRKD